MFDLKLKNWYTMILVFSVILTISWFFGDLISALFILAAFIIHEFTHILCSELLGYPVKEWTPRPFKGLKIDPAFEFNPDVELIVAIAGPLSNFMMVAGVLYLNLLGIHHHYLQYWLQINTFMGVFNLIPALPLDGGRILRACLCQKFNYIVSKKIMSWVSLLTGCFFLSLAWAKNFQEPAKILMILIGLFIIVNLLVNQKTASIHGWNSFQHKKKVLSKKGFLTIKTVLVEPVTPLKTLFHFPTHEYLLFFLPDKDQNMYIISEENAWDTFIKYGFTATFNMALLDQGNKTCRIPLDEVE